MNDQLISIHGQPPHLIGSPDVYSPGDFKFTLHQFWQVFMDKNMYIVYQSEHFNVKYTSAASSSVHAV